MVCHNYLTLRLIALTAICLLSPECTTTSVTDDGLSTLGHSSAFVIPFACQNWTKFDKNHTEIMFKLDK